MKLPHTEVEFYPEVRERERERERERDQGVLAMVTDIFTQPAHTPLPAS